MSRPLRVEYAGAWYHVMNRGLNRRRIFENKQHYQLFLELLSDIHKRFGVQIHSYCLMSNHYHLLLYTPEPNLSRAMRHLDGVYTQRFNRSVDRDGALFRGRYKAILVEEEHYALELSRYIHLNPVSAKLCNQAEDYAWSSYKAYVKREKKPEWLYCEEMILRCSGRNSIKAYEEFIAEGVDVEVKALFSARKWPTLLGSTSWMEGIKQQVTDSMVISKEVPASKELLERETVDIDQLMRNIAAYNHVTIDKLKRRGSRYSENTIRNWFIYLAATYGGYENKVIADAVGGLSYSGVSQVRRRVEASVRDNKSLFKQLEAMRQACF